MANPFHFFNALGNIALVIPYYFSVWPLLRTLFVPWKGLVPPSQKHTLSLKELFDRWLFMLISCGIGFTLRIAMILAYVIAQITYLVFVPVLIIIYIPMWPLLFSVAVLKKSSDRRKKDAKMAFLSERMLDEDHRMYVERWFEWWYHTYVDTVPWWNMSRLMSHPPMARDWALGYTPTLDGYVYDLAGFSTHATGRKIVGRHNEMHTIEEILLSGGSANVLVVGDVGVGRHTIVEAIGERIYQGHVHPRLQFRRLLELNMDKILSQHVDRSAREMFFGELLQEATASGSVILVIENIERYIGGDVDHVDLSGALEHFGKSNNLQIVGITTSFAYQKYIFPHERIDKLFTQVSIKEFSKKEAARVLLENTFHYENRYRVIIPYETIVTTIEKSDFYITSSPFPEKAIHLMDDACVYTVQTLQQAKVLPQAIDHVLSQRTHVPTSITNDIKEKLLHLEQLLADRIIDQDNAIREVASSLRRAFVLMGKRRKPIASFLFLGPTGVGKTETARAIAQIFFGSKQHLIRFDMSLYQSKTDISRLIGSPDNQLPGFLTQALRQQPYGILLLDEIEKADRDLLNIFLTILDEGYFVDGYGKRVDCKNVMVIATSNAGADMIFKEIEGYTKMRPSVDREQFSKRIVDRLIAQRIFLPEFLNRFDSVVTYVPLMHESIYKVAQKMLNKIAVDIQQLHQVSIDVSPETLRHIIATKYIPAFGARNIEHAIRTEIEDHVARRILNGEAQKGDVVKL